MVKRWDRFQDPWDREYAMRGRLWRGTARADAFLTATPSGGWVLELGCGDGKFLRALDEAGRAGLGLDRSRHALLLTRNVSGAPLVQADVRRLPFADGCVPVVAARFVLGALTEPDRARAAQEAWRVLSPGGVLYLEEFGDEDFRAGQGEEVELGTFERNRGILTHYWPRDELESMFPVDPVSVDERRWTQRAGAERRSRQAWRALWRRPG